MKPDAKETSQLEAIWRDQSVCQAPSLDLTRPALHQGSQPASAPEVAQALKDLLGWPQWVRLYAKPALAVVAASKLAKARGLEPGILWVAPGTGKPFDPPSGAPGIMMLRADWAPDPQSLLRAQLQARELDLMLVVDESGTGLRLAPGGAVQLHGLSPDVVLYGPSLAGGREFAALAGLGQAPPEPAKAPSPEALAAARATLASVPAQTARLEAWGRALALGLDYGKRRAGLDEEIGWEGPLALPRLKGSRLWAFIELAREEGLALEPLVLFDPGLEPELAAQRLWPRLCRATARLRALPLGDKAPRGWADAHGPGKCIRVEEILRVLES